MPACFTRTPDDVRSCCAAQGPTDYNVPEPGLPQFGKWTDYSVKSALELQIERAARVPGPGHYDLPPALKYDKVRRRKLDGARVAFTW